MKQDILTLLRTGHFNLANTNPLIYLDFIYNDDKMSTNRKCPPSSGHL